MRNVKYLALVLMAGVLSAQADPADLRLSGVYTSSASDNVDTPGTELKPLGDVDLRVRPGCTSLDGAWTQDNGTHIGVIQSGIWDCDHATLYFSYYQDWNNVSGSAFFHVSQDTGGVVVLDGTWEQSNGGKGRWLLLQTGQETHPDWSIKKIGPPVGTVGP
jgi:hypothetical protein